MISAGKPKRIRDRASGAQMLPSPCEVLPGEGFGPLLFGLKMAEVETMFGEAPRSYFEENGEDSFHVLGYPDVGVTLCFNQEHRFRLSSIEIEFVLSATFFGVLLFPMSKADVMRFLRSNLQESALAKITEECYAPSANEASTSQLFPGTSTLMLTMRWRSFIGDRSLDLTASSGQHASSHLTLTLELLE